MSESLGTIRAFHPASGSVVVGEVTDTNKDGDVSVILEGMLEQVILRRGVWSIHWTSS